jgi:aconitate hydratase
LLADEGAGYDMTEEIDLPGLVPLIARPGSPGDVVPVEQVAGEPVHQVVVGSSANPGLRDFAIVAAILADRQAHPQVSLDVNPSSRQILADLTGLGATVSLIQSGARLHQTGCLGCIGMGQAPAVGHNSLRTMPRNFPGRSGTADDRVWLCSPETAAAAALTGRITDPRRLDMAYPSLSLPARSAVNRAMLEAPPAADEAARVDLEKAPSIGTLPELDPLPDELEVAVAIVVGDDLSTDEILQAGAEALPYRSNIAKLAQFTFKRVDEDYLSRVHDGGAHAVIAGRNYGQGSSREHAVLAPRSLGLRLVLARSYARIHWQNLVNLGVLPLEYDDEPGATGDRLVIRDLPTTLRAGADVTVHNTTRDTTIRARHRLSPRQIDTVLAGGRIPAFRAAQ